MLLVSSGHQVSFYTTEGVVGIKFASLKPLHNAQNIKE